MYGLIIDSLLFVHLCPAVGAVVCARAKVI
nr:MAG TPA: hypothetical protein [Caudoviricetes sp.]